MSDESDMVRQTIRIHPYTKHRLMKLMKQGKWVNESELFRQALNIGIDKLEGKR